MNLNVKELKQAACDATGLEDFGPVSFEANYQQLLKSLNISGKLTVSGLKASRREFINLLSNRLEIQRWLSEFPEILREEVQQPIFATGLPRSGTTYMLHLFDHDERLQLLRSWETGRPCPPPGYAPETVPSRIERTQQNLASIWKEAVPDFDAIHLMDVEGPDESSLLLNNDFGQVGFLNYLNVPDYFDWIAEKGNFREIYQYHKKQLQLLQWKRPEKRWVDKFPNHLLAMKEITEVYGNPVFVMTHRDPVKTLASLCDLTANFRAARTDSIDRQEIGEQIFAFVKIHIDRLLEYSRANALQICHINYYSLVDDPLSEMGRAYNFLEMDMPITVAGQINSWVDKNPQGKRGAHLYCLQDFGLNRDKVEAAFSQYRNEYDIAIED